MKKIMTFLIFGITIMLFLNSCNPEKQAAKWQKKVQEKKLEQKASNTDFTTWTSKLQDTLKFTIGQLQDIPFYNSSAILMSGAFFSITSFVENGVIVVVDTTEKHSRVIEAFSEGRIIGIPQRDPGSWVVKNMHLVFTKGEMSIDFEFILDPNTGSTVLSKKGEITFQGKKYSISSYYVDQYGNYLPGPSKLMVNLEHRHVVIHDDQ